MKLSRLCTTIVVVVAVAACADTTGDDPPAGDRPTGIEVAVEVPANLPEMRCNVAEPIAALLETEDDIDAWVDECVAVDETRYAALMGAAAESSNDKKLVAVRMGLGCDQDWSLQGIYHDEDTLNVWVLRHDPNQWGIVNTCSDDVDSGTNAYWFVTGGSLATVTDVTLTVSVSNPNLPGAPLLPGGDVIARRVQSLRSWVSDASSFTEAACDFVQC